jgi:hypothetical protein
MNFSFGPPGSQSSDPWCEESIGSSLGIVIAQPTKACGNAFGMNAGSTHVLNSCKADMLDTKVGQSKKDAPVDVAKVGYEAMMNGEGDVVAGWKNKLRSAAALITPSDVLAEQHRKMAEPGSANK